MTSPPTPETVSILLRTKDHRGDHDADVCKAIRHKPGETIEQLMQRIAMHPYDVLELRVLTEGTRQGIQP